MFLSDEEPTLETLDYTMRIGSTPTFLYFDLYLYSAGAAHYTFIKILIGNINIRLVIKLYIWTQKLFV